ncbi:unnamed protein product [Sphagnum jensenii]|uniref:CBS domain-containing protein n=1 Tax=Sphagnum jensenii TaxID=128206 RepID=A0ABP1A8Q1_9BRYO
MSRPQLLPQKVEDEWSGAGLLSTAQRLNAAFEEVVVSAFPDLPSGKVLEIDSDANLADAVQLLGGNNILSAPVRDCSAPADSSWMDRYLGIIDFSNIVLWVLDQSEAAKVGMVVGAIGSGGVAAGAIGALGAVVAGATPLGVAGGAALAATVVGTGFGVTAAVGPAKSGPQAVGAMGTGFFEALTTSEFYKQTKVADIAGSFRWAPFLPVKPDDSLLTVLLLLSKYRIKSLPVVEPGEGQIKNFITQSAVIHFLSQCGGFTWFDTVGKQTLSELGLPFMQPEKVVKVDEDSPVIEAFQLMRDTGVGGVPVVANASMKLMGNISARDLQFLLSTPEIFKSYSLLTAGNFLEAVRTYLQSQGNVHGPLPNDPVSCTDKSTLLEIITKLDEAKIHRIYVLNPEGDLKGVVTLRDIISTFVEEPLGYFKDFFAGVVPATAFA